jgi:transposase
MQYIGLDAHKNQWTICVLDANGKKVMTRTILGTWKDLLAALKLIDGEWTICFEATCGAGFLSDQLKTVATKVVVANPGKLRLIFATKRKNDRLDAEKLAKLLLLDLVPPVHIPKPDVRAWRSLIEYRRKLMGQRTTIKNRLRALLRGVGKLAPRLLWTKTGLAWLGAEPFAIPADGLHRDLLVGELAQINEKVRQVTKELDRLGSEEAQVRLLQTIPGVGIRTAEAFVAYIDEAKRFSNTKAIGSYLGLVPTQDQSAETNHLGRITRQGPSVVRWLLTEAAWEGTRRSMTVRSFYERVRRNDPDRGKIAAVATAHYLARVMLAMLQSGEAWREKPVAARSPHPPIRQAS